MICSHARKIGKDIQPIQTTHVETVVQLVRKTPDAYIDLKVDMDELDLTASEAKAPTCTEKGVEARTCSCGDKQTRDVVAKGHTAGEWKTVKASTCTVAGEKAQICSVCGATIKTESIPALGHTYGAWTVTTAPTCTEKGVETRTCSCGAKETRDVAAKGHTPGDWKVVKDSTCTEPGEKVQLCSACDSEMKKDIIPAKGHTPGE